MPGFPHFTSPRKPENLPARARQENPDDKDLNLKEKRDLKNLVEAENKDRKRLYAEVAKALDIDPSQTEKVAKIFADKWQESVP